MGKLWSVFCEYFGEKLLCHKEVWLYWNTPSICHHTLFHYKVEHEGSIVIHKATNQYDATTKST